MGPTCRRWEKRSWIPSTVISGCRCLVGQGRHESLVDALGVGEVALVARGRLAANGREEHLPPPVGEAATETSRFLIERQIQQLPEHFVALLFGYLAVIEETLEDEQGRLRLPCGGFALPLVGRALRTHQKVNQLFDLVGLEGGGADDKTVGLRQAIVVAIQQRDRLGCRRRRLVAESRLNGDKPFDGMGPLPKLGALEPCHELPQDLGINGRAVIGRRSHPFVA